VSTTKTGLAGEYLVCSMICKLGYFAYLSAPSCRYDVVAEVGEKLIRIQVKATRSRGYLYTRKNISGYRFRVDPPVAAEEADLIAFVALDSGEVAFLSIPIPSLDIFFYPAGASKDRRKNIKNMDDYSFEKALGGLSDIAKVSNKASKA
jgi:hypothetical protein